MNKKIADIETDYMVVRIFAEIKKEDRYKSGFEVARRFFREGAAYGITLRKEEPVKKEKEMCAHG